MGRMLEGRWSTEWYQPDEQGRFVRPSTAFRHQVRNEPGAQFAPEAGRYRLYVSYACPWAHRTLIMRVKKGLAGAIAVTAVSPLMGEDGWTFDPERPECGPDPVVGAAHLYEVYRAADSRYTGRVTVPVLWDEASGTIVNNESRQILRMLDHDFDPIAADHTNYCPPELASEVDHVIDAIYEPINNGVYKAGFATTQAAYEEAVRPLFAALDHWDEVLGQQRYLCGDVLTEADWCLFTTLVRFDAVYYTHFKCNVRRIADYPHLSGYLRDLYQSPGVADTVRMDHIKAHYYWSHPHINPYRVVPLGPELDFASPPGREHLAARP